MTIRLTKKRQAILDVLKQNHGALSAAAIHAKLPSVDLATIYRNLDLFTEERLIKKLHLGEDEALYEFQDSPHHHAVCSECERVIHFKAPDQKIKELLNLKDFEIEELEVTVRGRHRCE